MKSILEQFYDGEIHPRTFSRNRRIEWNSFFMADSAVSILVLCLKKQ